MQIRVADAAGQDVHQCLSRTRVGDEDGFNRDGGILFLTMTALTLETIYSEPCPVLAVRLVTQSWNSPMWCSLGTSTPPCA